MKKLLLFLLIIAANVALAQMTCTVKQTYGINYLEYTPPAGVVPKGVILYFHGLGERGNNLDLIKRNEIPALFTNSKRVEPYIIICPQLPLVNSAGKPVTDFPKAFIISCFKIIDLYKLPRHITGLSLGGICTYNGVIYSYEYNHNKVGYFKTATSVAGRIDIKERLKKDSTLLHRFDSVHLIMYHGTADGTIPIGQDRYLYNLLAVRGVKLYGVDKVYVRKYEYTGIGHNSWRLAYKDDPTNNYWTVLRYLGY